MPNACYVENDLQKCLAIHDHNDHRQSMCRALSWSPEKQWLLPVSGAINAVVGMDTRHVSATFFIWRSSWLENQGSLTHNIKIDM